MTSAAAVFSPATSGISVLREIHELNVYDVAQRWDILRADAKTLCSLSDVYLGSTACTKLQRQAREAADRLGHSVRRLEIIEKHVRKLAAKPSSGSAWRFRKQLCERTGTCNELDEYAKKLVKKQADPPAPSAGIRFSTPRQGMRSVYITGDQHEITDLEVTLDALREKEFANLPRTAGLLKAWWKHLRSGAGLVKRTYTTAIVMGVDDAIKVLTQAPGAEEALFALTDGTTMTGADYLTAQLDGKIAPDVFCGLFQPVSGAINLYRARFAEFKQRMLAAMENPVCPWPGCNVPADRCQVHHLRAYQRGGDTNPDNLTTVCSYHNGANDDDPNAPPRNGRLNRHRGQVRYTSPGGRNLTNDHPNTMLGAMHLI